MAELEHATDLQGLLEEVKDGAPVCPSETYDLIKRIDRLMGEVAAQKDEITELKRSRDSFSGMWKRAALATTTLEDENDALAAQVEHTKQERDQLQEIAQNQAVGLMDAEIARITLEAQVERKLAEARKAEIEARHELQSVLPKECGAEEIISLRRHHGRSGNLHSDAGSVTATLGSTNTASLGATFTGTASVASTSLVVTAVTGLISIGDTVSGSGITGAPTIIAQAKSS
jgi:chromosome segregation ATPase